MISHIKSFLQDGRPIAYGATLLLAGFLVSQLDSPMPGTIGICQIASGILIILGGLFLLPLFRLAFDEVFFKRSFILVVALILIAWAFGVANQN